MRRLFSPVSIAVVVGVVALLGLLAYGVRSTAPDASIEAAIASGERPRAPELELPRLDGRGEASLADFRGRVVVLNYWASWCEPCRAESPLLERWHGRLGPRGGAVVGVDALDVTSDARAFTREFGLTYPMLRDADGATGRLFGVVGYPETVVIDRGGRIAALRRGPVDEEFMRREVTPLLAERA
jgi:cytochrome c biogenesis protein CcmG/thiol:disulfide interchange protein DsbE